VREKKESQHSTSSVQHISLTHRDRGVPDSLMRRRTDGQLRQGLEFRSKNLVFLWDGCKVGVLRMDGWTDRQRGFRLRSDYTGMRTYARRCQQCGRLRQ
jgi:hypothetical protein